MAISGVDIVSRHTLDDSQFIDALRRDEQVTRHYTSRVQLAQRSLSALNSTLFLFGGETTATIIIAGRAALSIGKLATSYGALTIAADASAAAMARASLAASAGAATAKGGGLLATATAAVATPVIGAAVAAAAVASYVYRDSLVAAAASLKNFITGNNATIEANKRLAETEERLATIQSNRAAVEFVGRTSPETLGLESPGRAAIERFKGEERRARAEASAGFLAEQLERGRDTTRRAIEDYVQRTVDDIESAIVARVGDTAARREALEDFEVRAGLRQRSSLISDPIQRRLQQFEETFEGRRRAIEEAGGTAFTIGTRPSSEFRFGFGPPGSVIGQQTEQKQTNKLLADLKEQEKVQAATLIVELRQLLGAGTEFTPTFPSP